MQAARRCRARFDTHTMCTLARAAAVPAAKSISASGRDGATTTLCAHAAAAAPAAAPTLAAAALSSTASRAGEVTTPPPCQPGVLLTLNVSDATDLVALTPHLLRADLLGASAAQSPTL